MRRIRILLAGFVGIAAAVFLWMTLARALWYDPMTELSSPPHQMTQAVITEDHLPARLMIPKVQIDASIEQIGLITSNRMAAPHRFSDAGWYKYGPAPGALGTAVILGHLDNGLGLNGVFKHLHELSPGDEVDVMTAQGKTLRFRVESLKSYPYDNVPEGALVSSDAARLALVTCAGHWIYTDDQGMTYDHRVVVEAVLDTSA